MRRLLTLVGAGAALVLLAAVAYRFLADRQLDHPVAEGRAV